MLEWFCQITLIRWKSFHFEKKTRMSNYSPKRHNVNVRKLVDSGLLELFMVLNSLINILTIFKIFWQMLMSVWKELVIQMQNASTRMEVTTVNANQVCGWFYKRIQSKKENPRQVPFSNAKNIRDFEIVQNIQKYQFTRFTFKLKRCSKLVN